MAWTPPSDAVLVEDKKWTPPKDAVLADKPAPAPAAAASKPEAPPALEPPVGGLSGEFAGFADAPATGYQSVLEGVKIPEPAIAKDKLLNPDFVDAMKRRLGAMRPEQRAVEMDRLLKRPDVYGRAAKVVAAEYAALDKAAKKPTPSVISRVLPRADSRSEAIEKSLIEQGLDPEAAKGEAQVRAGFYGDEGPKLQTMAPDVVGQEALVRAAAKKEELKDAGFATRVGAEISSQAGQVGLGLLNIAADITGDKELQGNIRDSLRVASEVGRAIPKGESIFEKSAQSAIATLTTQAPFILLGAVTGTAAPVLAPMALQVFGKEYGEGRQNNLSPGEAATRAGLLTTAEIFFERFGLTELSKAIRGAVSRIPTKELSGYLAKAFAKEVPAEQLTQATNFLIDKTPDIGLNPNAGWQSFLEGQAEALRQTVIMSGAQTGAIVGTAKGVQLGAKALQGREPGYVQDTSYEGLSEMLARSKGFMQPTEAPPEAAPETPEPGLERKGVSPTLKPEEREARTQEIADNYVAAGVDPNDAILMARTQIEREYGKAAERVPTTEAPADRIEALAQEFIDAGEDPQNARVLAEQQVRQEDEADALAQAGTKGPTDVAATVQPTDRAGVAVAGQPRVEPTAAGAGAPEPSGVVPAKQPATDVVGGERIEPVAVETQVAALTAEQNKLRAKNGRRPAAKSPAGKKFDELGQQIDALKTQAAELVTQAEATGRVEPTLEGELPAAQGPVEPTLTGEQLGTQAPQAVEAEAQGQAEPAAQPAVAAGQALDTFLKSVPDSGGDVASYKATEQTPWRFTQRAVGQVVTFRDQGKTHTGTITEVQQSDSPQGPREILKVTDSDPASGQDESGNPAPEKWTLGNDAISDVAPAPQTAAAEDAEATAAAEQTVGALADQLPKVQTKRGRKTLELTPEEQSRKDAALKEHKRKYAQGNRELERASAQLAASAAPIDESAITDDDALKAAQEDRRSNFLEGVRALLNIERNHRGTPLANRAKAILADRTKISQKDYDNLKRGFELTHPSKSLASSRIKPNPLLKGNMSAVAVLTAIGKNGTPFERMLANRLRKFLVGVRVYVVEEGDPTPSRIRLAQNAEAWERARGVYLPADQTGPREVYLRGASFGYQNGVNNVTALHELLHAAINHRIGLGLVGSMRGQQNEPLVRFVQELNGLMMDAGDQYLRLERAGLLPERLRDIVEATEVEDVEAGETEFEIFTLPYEFLAYGLTDPVFQQFLMSMSGMRTEESGFSRFVKSILKFLGLGPKEFTALSDLINITDDIFGAATAKLIAPSGNGRAFKASKIKLTPEEIAAAKEQKKIDKAVAEAAAKFDTSKLSEKFAEGVTVLQMAQNPTKVTPTLQGLWNGATEKTRRGLVKAPTTEFIAIWAGQDVPELKNTATLLQKMNGLMMQLLKSSGELTKEIEQAYRKDPSLREKLDRITRMATLAEVDPGDPTATKRSKDLDGQYADLGADGQRMYKRIRDHYAYLSDYFTHLLDEQITRSGLPLAEQANLIKKIRSMYETGSKISPYFPLVRRGDYWFVMGTGKNRAFMMFESLAERDRAVDGFLGERVKKKSGESDAEFTERKKKVFAELRSDGTWDIGNDVSSLRERTTQTSQLLTGMFSAIDASKLTDPDAKEKLKDDIYQLYLQTMPEQSFRRQFIHRKGIAGFRTDLLRDVADTTSKMAVQLSRIKYAPQLRNSISQARDSIQGRQEFEPFVAEMKQRVDDALNPGKESLADNIANALNKFAFIFYLGGASSALLQPLSLIQTGMPVLSRYGAINANREFLRAMQVWKTMGMYKTNRDGTKSWTAPSMEFAKNLSADERLAIREMLSRDVSTSTYANAVFDYKVTPSDKLSGPVTQFGKDVVNVTVLGGLMHSTERLTREMMYLMSYRLNRQAGKNHAESVDQAVFDTNEAFGNYGEYNRPGFMKGAGGKVLTQFMMYPVHVTLYLLRNFVEIIRPMDGRTRWEATKKFFGTLGATFVLGGAVALPMFSVVMGFIGAAWSALSGDDDRPKELRDMSYELWWRTVWLDEMLGGTQIGGVKLSDIVSPAVIERGPMNAITGADISSRTSLNNMWLRESKEGKDIRAEAAAFILEKAGPAANGILSMAEGIGAGFSGDYKKMVQKMAPAGFRNFVGSYNLHKEGAKDNKGTEILSRDDFTTGNLLFQAVGFRPDLLANTQYVNFKIIGLEQKILNQRGKLLDQLDRSYREGDADAYTKYFEDWQKFNTQYPTYRIEIDDLIKSLSGKAERRGKSWRGLDLTEKNVPIFGEAMRPSRAAVDEKRAANQK